MIVPPPIAAAVESCLGHLFLYYSGNIQLAKKSTFTENISYISYPIPAPVVYSLYWPILPNYYLTSSYNLEAVW